MKGGRVIGERVNGKMGKRVIVGLVPILVVVLLWVTSKPSQFFASTYLFDSPIFIFSILNSIILLMTLRNHEPQPHEQVEIIMELLQSSYHKPRQDTEFSACDEDDEDKNADGNRNKKVDRDGDEIEQSNENEEGEEDEDNDGVDEDEAKQCDEKKEEEEEELEKRIEEFIAKENKRWREEKLRENLGSA